MRSPLSTSVPVLVLLLAVTSGAWAQPTVQAELSHVNWTSAAGETIGNDIRPFDPGWMLRMEVTTPDVVTGPRVEFTSDGAFVEFDPTPTSVIPPSTYVWDYPGRSLAQSDEPLHVGPDEASFLGTPGLTATRSVDLPLLVNDVTVQTLDLTLRFEEAIDPAVNMLYVNLGAFSWDREEGMVVESVLSQNTVADWWAQGDGSWGGNPSSIVVGRDYSFQARIQCTKQPGFEGTDIFHKPQAFVLTGQWQNLPDVTGTTTSLTHPNGEAASYRLNESVHWQRSTSDNRQDVILEGVSVTVDGAPLAVDKIEMGYGASHDGQGTYIGHDAWINATGKNIVAAELTTPTGRRWSMEIEDGGGVELGFGDGGLSPADLATLGIVAGTYTFDFHGPDGSTITTAVDMTLETPLQVPIITAPADGAADVPTSRTFTWEPIWDSNVNGVRLGVEDEEETWQFVEQLPGDSSSCLVPNMPADTAMDCYLGFGRFLSGTTPEGIPWTTIGYSAQDIDFTTVPEPAASALLLVGGAGLLFRRRKARAARRD